MAYPPPEGRTDEQAEVYLRRFKEAVRAGWPRLEARLFAESDIDIGELRRLQKLGCPPHLAARLLL